MNRNQNFTQKNSLSKKKRFKNGKQKKQSFFYFNKGYEFLFGQISIYLEICIYKKTDRLDFYRNQGDKYLFALFCDIEKGKKDLGIKGYGEIFFTQAKELCFKFEHGRICLEIARIDEIIINTRFEFGFDESKKYFEDVYAILKKKKHYMLFNKNLEENKQKQFYQDFGEQYMDYKFFGEKGYEKGFTFFEHTQYFFSYIDQFTKEFISQDLYRNKKENLKKITFHEISKQVGFDLRVNADRQLFKNQYDEIFNKKKLIVDNINDEKQKQFYYEQGEIYKYANCNKFYFVRKKFINFEHTCFFFGIKIHKARINRSQKKYSSIKNIYYEIFFKIKNYV